MANEEKTPFLEDVENDKLPEPAVFSRGGKVLAISLLLNSVLLILVLLLGGTLFVSANHKRPVVHGEVHEHLSEPYSPANGVIEYEYRSVIPNDTRFTGHPGPAWEHSMHNLMEGTLLRISDNELKLSGSDSIPLKDGGYAAGLGVAHDLHCVKKIKQFLYKDYFYPDLDRDHDQYSYLQAHADHCLDFLRQGIMCNVDYSLYTVYWGERRQDIPTHRIPGVQKCVNWEKLHTWMVGRQASTDMLVGP